MADILPPAPIEAQFGAYNWVDWYKKVRDAINNASNVQWTSILGKPTTIAGYGITDAQTKIEFRDDGVALGTAGTVNVLDFTGVGVTATRIGNSVTVDVPGGGESSISGVATVTVPSPGRFEHEQAVAVPGVVNTDNIIVSLSSHLDSDENSEDALDISSFGATAGTNTILFKLSFTELTSGPIKINYMVI